MVLLVMLISLAGCRTEETYSENMPREETPSVTPVIGNETRLVDSGPVQGGTLTLPVTPVDTLNPYQTSDRYVNHISFFVFESLFVQTSEAHVEPLLVQSWDEQENTIWGFTLKQDVFFHHDQKLTAYDVKHSMTLLEHSDSPFYDTEMFNNILEVNVVNSNRLEVVLKTPDPVFIQKLTFPILPQTMEAKNTEYVSGTGPYRLDSIDESMVKLRRFEKWWEDHPPYIDVVVFKVYREEEMLDAFQNNETDTAFINNVDFSKYRYRTDMDFHVYPNNEGNFICVNPNGLFGQARRQNALFRYISFRLKDMNLGQVQYFDEYNESPIDKEGFRQALIESGLVWNELQDTFIWGGVPLKTVSIVVPEKEIQKLHMANFLVNILADAGVKATTIRTGDVKRVIRSGNYDLTPITEELKPWESLEETQERMRRELGYGNENSYFFPLYRNQQAILFKKHIRGEKNAIYWNPYQGFASWYIPAVMKRSLED
jgi:peptide/nickel transport system substrate-binding protein